MKKHGRVEEFQRLLRDELISAERVRAAAIGGFFTLALVLALLLVRGAGSEGFARHFGPVAQEISPWVMLVFILWEFGLWRWLGRHRDAGTAPGAGWQYLTTAVEMVSISVLVALTALLVGPIPALTGPPSLVYFLFIVLSGLRLDFKLCAFSGLLAAVGFAVVTALFLGDLRAEHPESIYANVPPHAMRCVFYLTAGLLAGAVADAIRRRTEAAAQAVEERRHTLDLFGQQVSPQVVDKLLSQSSQIENEAREVCVMFLDIRNFTRFSELRGAEEVVQYLNTLFDALIESVNRHDGIINKFLGDGFMAVFGAPLSDGRDAQNAVRAAHEILAEVQALVAGGTIPETRVGIGLHAGEAVTGNIGSHLRREYTVIGDVVNTAARIEAMNKQFDSQLLVSQTVYDAVADDAPDAVALEPVHVKGKAEPLQLYKLA
jgi:adenylate cyclase